MKFLILATTIVIIKFTSLSQTFEKEIGFVSNDFYKSSEAGCIFKTSTNHLLVTAVNTKGSSIWDAIGYFNILKLDVNGTVLIAKEFPFSTEFNNYNN